MKVYGISQNQIRVQQDSPYLRANSQSRAETLAGAWDLAKKIGNGASDIISNSLSDAWNCLRKNSGTLKGYASKVVNKVKVTTGKIQVTIGGVASGIIGAGKSTCRKLGGALIDSLSTIINLVRDIKNGDPNLTQASHSICIAAPASVAGAAVGGSIAVGTGGVGTAVGVAAGIATSAAVASIMEPMCNAAFQADEFTQKMEQIL